MTALEQFCKQKDNVIWMYFSINFYGTSGADIQFKYCATEHMEKTLAAIAVVHNIDSEVVLQCYRQATELGRCYMYDQNEVLIDIGFYYKPKHQESIMIEKDKVYA